MDEVRLHLKPATIFIVILLEGFVTIAVEMLTIRQLITVVGNSVIITSLIIGVFLLFLAVGYYRGGQYQADYDVVLKENFTWSALLLGIGISYPFIQLLFQFLFAQVTTNGLIALIVYLCLVTAPLVYLLGQTVPITTNLFRHEHHVGAISGKVLCLSTVGSFLGSVLSTLVLMNFFGVAWTIFLNYALLIILTFLLLKVKQSYLHVGLLILASFLIYFLNVGVEQKIFNKTNNYADYQILSNITIAPGRTGTLLNINNSPSSFLSADKKGFEYIEMIKKILFSDLALRNKDILALGAGGFTLSAEATYGNRFLYVDIDGAMPQIVKNDFIDQIQGKFITDDARKFLMYSHQKFDAVVSDVYSNRHTIPFHLLTKEYFENIQNILKPSGVAIFNIIANPTLKDNYSKRVDNTIRSVFKNCNSIPMPYFDGPANIIYICTPHANQDKTIYTDNLNGSMIDLFKRG